jgi:hypothetical protein
LEKLYEVLPAYGGMDDVYIFQNRFYDSRSNARLAELSTMYTDLDYYKRPELAEMHAAGVLDLALESLVREKIPRPSLAMATGRGWPSSGATNPCRVTPGPSGGVARSASSRF